MESTILLKKIYLFKIVELKNLFKQKLIIDLVILNKWDFFSGIIDKWCGPLDNYIISSLFFYHAWGEIIRFLW